MKIIHFICTLLSCLVSQDHLDALIQDVLHGSRDSAAIYIPAINQKYPNNPTVMYLKGLLETDGDEAMTIFSNLYNTHPTSEYGDDAVMKVAEYYYAAGLYVQASNWLKKMPIYYSRSEHIERAVKLFLNSLIVSGHRDTAFLYSRVFERQFPTLDVDGKINHLLQEYEKSKKQKEQAEAHSTEPVEPVDIPIEYQTEAPIDQIESALNSGIYSLQSGVYSILENADQQKINLIIAGFDARITELYRNNKVLYAVRIGYFNSKEDARQIGSQIKTKVDLDTIVVTNN